MTNEQPNALRIADYLDDLFIIFGFASFRVSSDELRRLHGENEELRDKLAQPEQKPVAWRCKIGKDYVLSEGKPHIVYSDGKGGLRVDNGEPLYTAPPKREFQFSTIEEAMQPMPSTPKQPQTTDDETRFANAFTTLIKAGYGKEAETILKCKREWGQHD